MDDSLHECIHHEPTRSSIQSLFTAAVAFKEDDSLLCGTRPDIVYIAVTISPLSFAVDQMTILEL